MILPKSNVRLLPEIFHISIAFVPDCLLSAVKVRLERWGWGMSKLGRPARAEKYIRTLERLFSSGSTKEER